MNYDKTIGFLYGLERFGIQFGLKKITYLLSLLNNPQDSFKSIHIAGTNGKGSTSCFISSVLKEAGFRTGLYTSPHLVDFRERFQINGVLIPRKRLTEIVERMIPLVRKTNDKLGVLTYFEVSTAIAFEYFKEEEVDFACIEVGMGGRLDATNIITPVISIITSIGFDHTKELGKTLEKIASEKAGIIKKNGILICGVREKKPLRNIEKICLKKNAKMYLLDRDFKGKSISKNDLKSQKFSYKGIWAKLNDFNISLLGEHQIQNASLALAVIEILNINNVSKSKLRRALTIKRGLKKAVLPGRFEIIHKDSKRIGASTIILDGAHNPPGANRLYKSLKKLFPNKKINFILGILNDKDISGIIKELLPLAEKVFVSAPHYGRASSLDKQAEIVKKYIKPSPFCVGGKSRNKKELGKDVEAVYPIKKAIRRMIQKVSKNEIICITGSLYTVGEARKALLSGH